MTKGQDRKPAGWAWPLKPRRAAKLIFFPVLFLLGACAMRGGDIPYGGAALGPADRLSRADTPYDLVLGPLDELTITVFRIPDLSGDYQVDSKGFLNLPLLGPVNVRNLDATAFAQRLEQLYGERYLNNPQISVRVTNTSGTNITVEGGVTQPGVYALAGPTTLLGAIATAHGIDKDTGNPRRVAIFRKQNGETVAAAFDLIDIRHRKMDDPMVYPGDTVVVDADNLRQIYHDFLTSLPSIAVFSRL
ncbi:polysaccharide biosynthesis/export family protein [Novosphingobium naphthalenivorans]|uniref:polysaccharide biosynthesis/export family protein n=1 Tax=Novosphingobium naphthalenivorans TaxID=273168 RepID=UPI00082B8FE1|nr:polysaccharide biosynthesis/export family protein [Novosphingobium naphthalenivorans]